MTLNLLKGYSLATKQTSNANHRLSPSRWLAVFHQHANPGFDHLAPAAAMALHHGGRLGHGPYTLAHFLRRGVRGKGALNKVKLGLVGHTAILANACASRALI